MRYLLLASDYDGTLAHHGRVDQSTLEALKRWRSSGRRLALVTGRELDDLLRVFDQIDLFDIVVAENGALLYDPREKEEQPLGPPPPPEFVEELRRRGVDNLSAGRAIVATWTPHEQAVLETIRDLGLEWHVIFNKGAVMALPSGVNKAFGLERALERLRLSPHNVVAIGDAENDSAFLAACETGVAVDNALDSLKRQADFVTAGDHGAGVVELIDRVVESDWRGCPPRLERRSLQLGDDSQGRPVRLRPYGRNLLLAGPSASGKSTICSSLLEMLAEQRYQFCVIDPEGDYEQLPAAVSVGGAEQAPSTQELIELLERPSENVSLNLLGVALEERPRFFQSLLTPLQTLQERSGRPHWIIVDEAHHLLPADSQTPTLRLPSETLLITVHPDSVAASALETVGGVLAVGAAPLETIRSFCRARGIDSPAGDEISLSPGEALFWGVGEEQPLRVKIRPPKHAKRRHLRKYATGELSPDRSFYFRGPHDALNLRAKNLMLFLEIGEGVDDATWRWHFERGDYSRWIRDEVKDEELAAAVEAIERDGRDLDQDRRRLREEVEDRYTLPA